MSAWLLLEPETEEQTEGAVGVGEYTTVKSVGRFNWRMTP